MAAPFGPRSCQLKAGAAPDQSRWGVVADAGTDTGMLLCHARVAVCLEDPSQHLDVQASRNVCVGRSKRGVRAQVAQLRAVPAEIVQL